MPGQTKLLNLISGCRCDCARAFVIALMLAMGGCVSDGPPPRPAPRPMPVQPVGSIPARMAFSVGNAADTDNNGYLDTVQVVSFLYGETHPISLEVAGTYEFRLSDSKGVLLRRWAFDQMQVEKALIQPLPGPAYAFKLCLLDAGTDQLAFSAAEMQCVFTPAATNPAQPPSSVTSGRGHTVQVGKIRE